VNNRGDRSQRRFSRFYPARLSTVNSPDHETSGSSWRPTQGKHSEPIAYRAANILRTINDVDKLSVSWYERRSGEGSYRHVRGVASNGGRNVAEYVSVQSQSRCLMSLASPHTRRTEARKCCLSVVAKANYPAPGVTDASEYVRVVGAVVAFTITHPERLRLQCTRRMIKQNCKEWKSRLARIAEVTKQ
jgi:hypothetical protein